MRDDLSNMHFVCAIAPVAAQNNADTAIVSDIIDTLGYDSLTFAILNGTNTDANVTFAVTMEHGNDAALGDTAATTDFAGTAALAASAFGDDKECRKIGYIGNKRYVRLTVTPTGNNAGDIYMSAIAVLTRPSILPTANPPQ